MTQIEAMTLNDIEDRLYKLLGRAYGLDSRIRHTLLYQDVQELHEELQGENDSAASQACEEAYKRWETQGQQRQPSSAPPAGNP